MVKDKLRYQRGSALIGLLIAALIIAVLWVARHRNTKSDKAEEIPPNPQSVENMQKNLDKARDARDAMTARANEMNKRMREVDE